MKYGDAAIEEGRGKQIGEMRNAICRSINSVRICSPLLLEKRSMNRTSSGLGEKNNDQEEEGTHNWMKGVSTQDTNHLAMHPMLLPICIEFK